MKVSIITKTMTLCVLSVGGLLSTADAMQPLVNQGIRHRVTGTMRVGTPYLSRRHHSTVVPPHSVDLREMKLSEKDKVIKEFEELYGEVVIKEWREKFIRRLADRNECAIKYKHIQTLSTFDSPFGRRAQEIKELLESDRTSLKYRKATEAKRDNFIAEFFKWCECYEFSEDMKKFMKTYDHKIWEYGVVQKSYSFLYTNISHRARESHKDLCMFIDWVHGDKYIGPNMIGRKYEDNLSNRQEISRYFKQRDSSFNFLPDDLKTLIFQMQENSEKLYGYNNDLYKILDSRLTSKFDVKLCLKTLKKIKPVLMEITPHFETYVDEFSGWIKQFEKEYKGERSFKPLPYGSHGYFEYYDHLWYGMTRYNESSYFGSSSDVAIPITLEQLAALDTVKNMFANIDCRHKQEDNKPFIPAPYIVDRSKE